MDDLFNTDYGKSDQSEKISSKISQLSKYQSLDSLIKLARSMNFPSGKHIYKIKEDN